MNFGARAGKLGQTWGLCFEDEARSRLDGYLRRLGADARLVVSIEPQTPRRTNAQLRLRWRNYEAALRKMSALSGHTKEELHEAMKRRFVEPTRLYSQTGELVGETYTTKHFSTVQESEFIERVLALFAGWGCDLME